MKPVVLYVDGLGGLIKVLGNVAEIPQKCVTKAAGKGANIVRRAVKINAPVGETGMLKRGIVRSSERSRTRGKKVYDIGFDRNLNDVFQKPIKNPGAAGGKSDHAYYPASNEFGFLTRSKGHGLDYVPGYHFMRDATVQTSSAAKRVMVDELNKNIDREWSK